MPTNKPNGKLRFGALIRVSTEGQTTEKRKESLPVQRANITQDVESLGGKIVEWYGGQEHATPGYEKKEIDRLLADAAKGKFDAFICDKNDRWSRDNTKSSQGLDLFEEHGIRFFVRTTEYNLHVPEHRLFVEMNVIFASFQARSQKQRSLASRIKRAQRGCSSCGKRPWGRTWDKHGEKWGIDEAKKAVIEDVARRYLAGESMAKLAEEHGMNLSNLHKILTRRCGDEWEQTFRPEGQPPEKVTTKIPRLLPEQTIKAIHRRIAGNKTYTRRQGKNSYLLSRTIFCQHCGYAMFGQTNDREQKRRYYRHAHHRRIKECQHPKTWIPADEIEELVMLHLFDCFGNPQAVQQAVEKASGDIEKIKEYRTRLARIEGELEKIAQGRQRVLDLVIKDAISQPDAEDRLKTLKDRESALREERDRLSEFLGSKPTPEQIEDTSKRIAAAFRTQSLRKASARFRARSKPLSEMTWEEKRELCQMVFSGKTPDGRRMGVYVKWDAEGKDWTFDIHGHLIEGEGLIRWSEKTKRIRREYLEEEGPAHLQQDLLDVVSQSPCDCTGEAPRGCRFRGGIPAPAG
jgi:site-specific DNA recombinase